MRKDFGTVPSRGLGGKKPSEQLSRGIHGHDTTVQIQGNNPTGEGFQDAVRVALEVRELLEMTPKISVGRLERRALLEKLAGHVVERDGKLTNLVRASGHDLLVQLAAGDRGRPLRELANRPGDSPGHQRREHASQRQRHQRQGT